MEWVFDNLENVIVPIIILILYGLGNAAQGKKKKRNKRKLARPSAKGRTAEADQQAREIREEIKRKIAERSGAPAPPAPPPPMEEPTLPGWRPYPEEPLPADREMPAGQAEELPEPIPSYDRPVPAAMETEVYLDDFEDRLEGIEERLRQFQEQARAEEARIRRPAGPVEISPRLEPVLLAKGRDSLRAQLFRDLAHPLGQRKAILVSEILGKPIGLKGPADRQAKW